MALIQRALSLIEGRTGERGEPALSPLARSLPQATNRSTVLGTTLIPEMPATEKAASHWRKNADSFWSALDEDFALGVSAQSTLASGASSTLYFGATECRAVKFQADVEAEIGLP